MEKSFEILYIYRTDRLYTPYEIFKYIYRTYDGYGEVASLDNFKVQQNLGLFEYLQKVLQEPLKFLKDPNLSFIALKTLKYPNTILIINFSHDYCCKISKESINEISKDLCNNYFRNFIDMLPLISIKNL